jgi:hypothetical protein
MNLIEIIAFYATLVRIEGRVNADRFLTEHLPSTQLHTHVKACVNDNGAVITSKGTLFFMDYYEGSQIAPPKKGEFDYGD